MTGSDDAELQIRAMAIEAATRWASQGWDGTAFHTVAIAQVFEYYLRHGDQLPAGLATELFTEADTLSKTVLGE
jgi:hypothetical protein